MSLFLYGWWFLDILKKFRSHEDIFILTSKSFKAFFFEFCYLFNPSGIYFCNMMQESNRGTPEPSKVALIFAIFKLGGGYMILFCYLQLTGVNIFFCKLHCFSVLIASSSSVTNQIALPFLTDSKTTSFTHQVSICV